MTFVILLWDSVMMFVMVSHVLCFVYWLVTISDYLLKCVLVFVYSFDKFHVYCFLQQILETYWNDMICMYVRKLVSVNKMSSTMKVDVSVHV